MYFSLYVAVFLAAVVWLCRTYLGWLFCKIVARRLSVKSIKITGIRLFGMDNVKVIVRDGLSVEIQDFRLSSSLFNVEHRKPIMFTASDVRVESELSLIQKASEKVNNLGSSATSTTSVNQSEGGDKDKLMQWLQYIGAKVKTSNVVLLDAIPDCLMHVTLEGLQLETYLDREGLQVELVCKLIQSKLFWRKKTDALLLDIGVAGSASVDVADRGRLKRLGVVLQNPRITLFDGVVDYLNVNQSLRKPSRSAAVLQSAKKKKEMALVRLLKRTPNINFDVDNLTMQYVATTNVESPRTLSLCLQKMNATADTALQTASLQFVDCFISDHAALSSFRGQSFSATIEPKLIAPSTPVGFPAAVYQASVHILTPFVVLYQHDLSWWLDYVRGPQFEQLFRSNTFADDFSRDFSVEEAKLLQNTDMMREQTPEAFSRVFLEAELTDFQCQLKNRDGSAVVFGIDLATFSADQGLQDVEFGVESLWCHHATPGTASEKLTIDFEKHTWGTTVAIGAGLAKFTQQNTSRLLCIQLDEVAFEWEEEVVCLIVDFVQSLRRKDDDSSTDSPESATFEPPEMTREDSWSSIDTMSSRSKSNDFGIQLSARKLDLFFTAKRAAFLAFSVENWKFVSSTSAKMFNMEIESIRIAQGELKKGFTSMSCNWPQTDDSKQSFFQKCGGCDKVSVRYVNNPQSREFVTHLESSMELIWSPLAYMVFYEVFRKIREISMTLASTTPKKKKMPLSRLLLTIVSDYPVEFGFKLPRDHVMRWVVPSIQFVKVDAAINLAAPTFLFEMDGHLIMSLESPRFQRQTIDSKMDMGRGEFKSLHNRTNKLWWWHADVLQIVFPYKYDFAAAFEEMVNSVKWIKQVHGVAPKKFTADSPLPLDLKVTIKKASMQLNDDPFEVQLQTIYEVMMDEVFERERRRQMLEEKINLLLKEDPLFPKNKIDALYEKLALKDAQIYVDRIRKYQQPAQRQLFFWELKGFELKVFADQSFHGKQKVVEFMQHVNPESHLNGNAMEFSTMWARGIELDVAECKMHFRDYPMPYMDIKEAYFWGTVAAAEHLAGERSIREQFVHLPEPWGTYQVNRNMCPLKFYYDLSCEITQFNTTYGPCWEPCLSMISLCWNYVNAPSRDPSLALPVWDKIRLLLHGRFSMICKRLVTSMLASMDPYNDTEIFTIDWSNLEFDWVTCQFRINSAVNAFIRTASKYDDSRLLYLPPFKWGINLEWICPGSPHDHHAVTPVAPNKLPEYSTNIEHDSYRSFRSSHLNVSMNFEVKGNPAEENSTSHFPQVLVYANTVKWFDFLKNTLMLTNRPVKRGPLFGNPYLKKHQLSKHVRDLHVNASLPRFMTTYCMSYSTVSHGTRMFCNNFQCVWTAGLRTVTPESNDGVQRKPKTAWKTSLLSIQLENAQIRCYGADRQPESGDIDLSKEDTKSFFMGLSRLNYDRETNEAKDLTNWNTSVQQLLDEANNMPAVHRITVHDLKASWTVANRDTCLAVMEGLQKAHLLKKILSNDAMKILEFNEGNDVQQTQHHQHPGRVGQNSRNSEVTDKSPTRHRPSEGERPHGTLHSTLSTTFDDGGASTLLWKLVDEAETNLVAYSEDSKEPPKDSLHGVSLINKNDVLLNNWQIDLLNSQVVLNGCEKDGFIIMTAAKASVTQRLHLPVWRNAQLLLKKSWTAMLSGMQYFAPLMIGKATPVSRNHFRWLKREEIEEKLTDASVNDKIDNYSGPGVDVGGLVVKSDDEDDPQIQRVASRCSCQMFFVFFSDILNVEKFEKFLIPKMNDNKAEGAATWFERRDDVDCFTLKHNMLQVCTNAEQYQMTLDIVNNLVLFVDPKKKQAEEERRRLWFKLAKISKEEVRASIQKMQSDLREVVAILRSLERQTFFLNRQLSSGDPTLYDESEHLKKEIDECKLRQMALIDELARTISCFKERDMEERSEIHRQQALQHDDEQSLIARRFEVCFEDAIWVLTGPDGQLRMTEMQIRNFLYTRTARIDNSGEHLLEVQTVKVMDMTPKCHFKEVLARLPPSEGAGTDNTPDVRIICRELPPVGGISVKEHFEVNVVPMHVQMTHKFYEEMMTFFFPNRNISTADQQNLDQDDNQPPQTQAFSLTRRLRGAVNGSFRKPHVAGSALGNHLDEIDKMKERAERNNVFVYVIIPQVKFIVSYRGDKQKNIEDVNKVLLTIPVCEYHDKNWTWLEMALALKQRCRRALVQQFMTQKLFRQKPGLEKASESTLEPDDEEEKKRIVLGSNMPAGAKGKKKSKS